MTEPKTWPGIGKCIYCGALEETHKLTDEHIMPDGLRGNQKIERASCEPCQVIINRFETKVLREMLRAARIHSGIHSRKSKERVSELPLHILKEGTERFEGEKIEVPIADHPYVLTMPSYPRPRMLAGLSRKALHNSLVWCCQPAFQPDLSERIERLAEHLGPLIIRRRMTAPHTEFMRMLAKIAHCAVIMRLHDHTFPRLEYLLPNVILGSDPHLAYYVGGELCCSTPRLADPLETGIDFCEVIRWSGKVRLAVVKIDIFGPYGMPRHHVVAGKVV